MKHVHNTNPYRLQFITYFISVCAEAKMKNEIENAR